MLLQIYKIILIYNGFKLSVYVLRVSFYFNFVFMVGLVIIIGFVLFGYAGYKIAIGIFELIFGKPKKETINFIDNSVHYHIHDHKSVHIIDDGMKENIINNLN